MIFDAMKWIINFSVLLALLVPKSAEASNVEVTKDPMQDMTRLRYDVESKPYLIRGTASGDTKAVQLYIVHSYYGDARYTAATVRWIDGTLKRPELYDVDTDFNCSDSRYLGCRKTIHKIIKIIVFILNESCEASFVKMPSMRVIMVMRVVCCLPCIPIFHGA